jgi:NADH dehydrogenase
MATIGRSKAIVDLRGLKVSGFIAWLIWLFLHVLLLIGFRNRLAVLVDWAWAYLTRERSARLITGDAEELRNALEFLQARPDTSIAEVVSKPKASAAK